MRERIIDTMSGYFTAASWHFVRECALTIDDSQRPWKLGHILVAHAMSHTQDFIGRVLLDAVLNDEEALEAIGARFAKETWPEAFKGN